MMKKVFGFLGSLVLLFSNVLLPFTNVSFAIGGLDNVQNCYQFSNSGGNALTLLKYKCDAQGGTVDLRNAPLEDGEFISAIAEDAFSGTNVGKVILPSTVSSIGNGAFCSVENEGGSICGNGIIEEGEECDDGENNGMECTSECNKDVVSELKLELEPEFYEHKYEGQEIGVEYVVRVTNKGNVTVRDVDMNDECLGNVDKFVLSPGETKEFIGTCSFVNAGEYTITNAVTGVYLSNQLVEVGDEFTFNVLPREIVLTSASDSKTYDGTALTNDEVMVSGDGFVAGEGVEYDVVGSQTLVGSSQNTFTYTLTEGTLSSNYDITVEEGILEVTDDDVDKDLVVTKSVKNGVYTGYDLGDIIEFIITATNIYEEAKTIILNEIEGVTLSQSVFENVAAGETIETTATYTITESDILAGRFINAVTAIVGSLSKTAEAMVRTSSLTGHLSIEVETTSIPANGESYALGEDITYRITVTNNGNLTITDITVDDELSGDEWTIDSLAPGESEEFSAVYTVTEADILAGEVVNIATARGTSPDPNEPDVQVEPGEDPEPTEDKNGHLTVTKETTSIPANGEGYVLGEEITYKITVMNDGNLTITDITVDDELSGDEWTIDSLAPGEKKEFSAVYTVTEADILAGEVVNIATARGTSPDPAEPDVQVEPGEDPEPTVEPNGHLSVEVETTSIPANGEGYDNGEEITYRITVMNDGNLTITDITVEDELSGDEWTIESLAPGESEEFSAEYTITEADILAGEVVNIATARGTSPDPAEPDVQVEPGEDPEPTAGSNGHLLVEKITTNIPANGESYALDEEITYKITVKNNGNLTITNIELIDEKTGDEWTIDSLIPGEKKEYTANYTVTGADILAGEVVNIATAEGTSPDPDEPDVPVEPGEVSVSVSGDEGGGEVIRKGIVSVSEGETVSIDNFDLSSLSDSGNFIELEFPDGINVGLTPEDFNNACAKLPKYRITWIDGDGEILDTEMVEYGQMPVYSGTNPTKLGDAQYTYTFNGSWIPEIVNVVGDVSYTAQFDSMINSYEIVFRNRDGEELYRTGVEYGEVPEYGGETPTKPSDVEYTYEFKGWSPSLTGVTTGAIYTALFSGTKTNNPSGGGSGGGGGKTTNPEKTEVMDSEVSGENDNNVGKDTEDNKEQSLENSILNENQVETVESVENLNTGSVNSIEMQKAYSFAYSKGITTKSSIEDAKMYGILTRIEMAKMLSNYAINIMGKQPDLSEGVVDFKDVSSKQNADYDNAVTLSYQLGIMGQNMPNNRFRPNDIVTRAEFVAAFSRMLYGTSDGKYESTRNYYMNHMQKLEKEGIVTKTDPNMKERRGYVMIMLKRSANK